MNWRYAHAIIAEAHKAYAANKIDIRFLFAGTPNSTAGRGAEQRPAAGLDEQIVIS